MSIDATKTIPIGTAASYEDMANPRRDGTVTEAASEHFYGDRYLVEFEDGDYTWTDLRQAGWMVSTS